MTRHATPPATPRPFRPLAPIVLALSLAPAAASACMPAPREGEAPVFQQGERGAMLWLYGGVLESRLNPAEDLGGGFVAQVASAGNGCADEVSTIVQDCASGEAVAYGGRRDPESFGQWTLQDALTSDIRARIAGGRPWTVAEIGSQATARGLEFAVPMRTTSRFRLGEQVVELGGGCAAFYPDLPVVVE